MVRATILLAGLAAASVHAAPLQRRIAQVISESTAQWEQACIAAGGGQQCNPISVKAFSTLLAAPGPCAQQDSGDEMVDLAKQLGSAEMIRLAQIFVQQPRNTPTSLSTPYCQTAPRNAELNGLFQCQFEGANLQTFVGGVAVGQPGTVPLGLTELNPLGSCPANPGGPIPDGVQLVTLVQNPGAGNGGGAPPPPPPAPTVDTSPPAETDAPAPPVETNAPPAGGNGGFQLANGQEAQKLNAEFATLSADSPCEAGQSACVNGGFAQCVNGRFAITQCAGGLTCAALPLVNAPGTSITCTTVADAEDRIARTGATGGLTGNGAGNGGNTGNTPAPAPAPAPAPSPAPQAPPAGDFRAENGRQAQALNAQFATLNENSPCNAGENACVNGGFAQCLNGRFAITQCAGSLTCAALPLVNAPGTSIACTTEADAAARIAASGATGGIRG
ncbi:hypothetical protein CC1G_00929 [Coprinopsis cinerea okayama7|uniref:Proline-rich protein n=1 Tax=Coprinopsis cinerea (strain Okayama-7 / 130 / ATCC MYA-4618 / FGSC 9003) TaxID=240176 RepID=A8N954_COPC7|nr:hypothetical protein CC1G_00929 [Coprinopsis cinerea okayama7\|eukprot:XP_001831382.1 hypothetical protein CC1G_00929 [Coprinopsis cinerea okayama7\